MAKKPAKHKLYRPLTIRLTPAEHARLAKAAAPYKVTTWARVQLFEAADKVLKRTKGRR